MAVTQWTLVEADLDAIHGSEQGGSRPVLIVSNDEFNRAIPNVTVLPLTSTQRRLYPAEVASPRGSAGQRLDSIVLAHQIRTISQRRLGREVGVLSNAALRHSVQEAIKEHLGLP
jgi:mRNA interferase MazF